MTADELAAKVLRAVRRPGAARILLLDLDGTLAPIAPSPERAEIPAATLEILKRLCDGGWTVAIVSGRPLEQVRRLVPLRGLRAFGSHGLEGSWDGRRRAAAVAPPARRRLQTIASEGGKLVERYPGSRLERKPAGVAFHDRGLDGSRLRSWRRSLEKLLGELDLEGLERIRGKRVLEIRPEDAGKGRVVRALPLTRRRGPDPSLIAIGDDRADEEMFRALGSRGLTILVGRPRRSAAQHRLPSPRAVARFLELLAE